MKGTTVPILRVARPTNDLAALIRFYGDGLGFEVIGQFENHAGFDGVMLGHPNAPYHLEFTKEQGKAAGGSPSAEHLLVFYLSEKVEFETAVQRMEKTGFATVTSHNPYWDQVGRTFQDPDGYRVVLQNAAWTV
jgi:catechol 2,3-dioxygenase-like lactoylglutathione lyase family enzyme